MPRRIVLWSAVCVLGVPFGSAAAAISQSPSSDGSDKVRIYLGTYTGAGGSQGIYRLELDRRACRLRLGYHRNASLGEPVQL